MMELGQVLNEWAVQRVFLTATLPPSEVERFCEVAKLPMNRVKIFRSRTSRSNIWYRVIEGQSIQPRHQRQGFNKNNNSSSSNQQAGPEEEAEDIQTVKTVRDWLHQHNNGQVIIYAGTIDRVEQLAKMLECNMYQLKVDTAAGKEQRLQSWIENAQLIVATNALGLGMDVPDVRLVVHTGVPSRLRDYMQESRQAERDGGRAKQSSSHTDRREKKKRKRKR
jgi:superfamily II DNA helicase RecQ